MGTIEMSSYHEALERARPLRVHGKVSEVTGLLIKASGLKLGVGEACRILTGEAPPVDAEVVGFRDGEVLLMAVGELQGIRPGSSVVPLGRRVAVRVGPALVGRVLDDKGSPIDGKGPVEGCFDYPIFAASPNPLTRRRITEPIDLGIRSINGLVTCGKGQRVGIMSGSGVGKSVLLGMMAKYTGAEVNVIALVGERAREVREFLEKNLGPEGLARSVVVVTTAEAPPLAKVRAAFTATAIAEYFRDEGKDVLLLMDSITRVAMAQRQIGLAVGEPPTAKGYTPSVFAILPKVLERVGTTEGEGSITGLYTVLVEGDDFSEPVADAVRAIVDGHIVLTRELAVQNHYPAVDVLQSKSRVMPDIVDPRHMEYAGKFMETIATYRKVEDMINLGAYKEGSSEKVDRAIGLIDGLNGYLRQGLDDRRDFADSLQGLYCLFDASGETPAGEEVA